VALVAGGGGRWCAGGRQSQRRPAATCRRAPKPAAVCGRGGRWSDAGGCVVHSECEQVQVGACVRVDRFN
jgi:hypothetical protein